MNAVREDDGVRVEWTVIRDSETFRIIAERNADRHWDFFDKSVWEIRWHSVVSTSALVAKADALASVAVASQCEKIGRAA